MTPIHPRMPSWVRAPAVPTILVAIALSVFAIRAWIAKDHPSSSSAESIQEAIKDDPKIGNYVDLPSDLGRYRSAILIVASLCNCDEPSLEIIANRPGDSIPVRIIAPADERSFSGVKEIARFRRFFVLDPGYATIRALNAVFMPRAYRFKRGRLVWKSEKYEPSWLSLIEAAEKVSQPSWELRQTHSD